jgi:hypothetical protein
VQAKTLVNSMSTATIGTPSQSVSIDHRTYGEDDAPTLDIQPRPENPKAPDFLTIDRYQHHQSGLASAQPTTGKETSMDNVNTPRLVTQLTSLFWPQWKKRKDNTSIIML